MTLTSMSPDYHCVRMILEEIVKAKNPSDWIYINSLHLAMAGGVCPMSSLYGPALILCLLSYFSSIPS